MAPISIARRIEAPHGIVWAAIADLGSHTNWMRDARSMEFVGDQRRGNGTRMEVESVFGPFRTVDIMEVVGWEEGRRIEVDHRGLITGRGSLGAYPVEEDTMVIWEESLVFPWWLGGVVTAWLTRPMFAAIWRGNLRRLEESLSVP
jgi:hypothetical protein